MSSEELLMLMVDSCASVLLLVNAAGVVVRANPACSELLGRTADAILGHNVWDALPCATGPDASYAFWADALNNRLTSSSVEQVIIDRIGNRRRLRWTFAGATAKGHALRYMIATGVDVTRERLAEGIWRQRAETDPLTGLANRAAFAEFVQQHAELDSGMGAGVMFCDLDNFKLINDTYGHAVGDEVLVKVADRLRRCVREGDVVARFGGDEFAIVLPGVGDIEMRALGTRVQAAVNRPMKLSVGRGSIGVSVGHAIFSPGQDTDETLRLADAAMYRMKTKRNAHRLTA